MFNWQGYMTLAEELVSRPCEASRRSAISRAYYAVYGVCCEHQQNPFSKEEAPHGKYWGWCLGDKSDQRKVKLCAEAGRLLKNRRDADYVTDLPYIYDNAAGCVDRARAILNRIQEIYNPP